MKIDNVVISQKAKDVFNELDLDLYGTRDIRLAYVVIQKTINLLNK